MGRLSYSYTDHKYSNFNSNNYTMFTYDEQGNLKNSRTYINSDDTENYSECTFTYAENGDLVSREDDYDKETYSYEYENGKLISVSKNVLSWNDQHPTYDYISIFTYDENGNIIEETDKVQWGSNEETHVWRYEYTKVDRKVLPELWNAPMKEIHRELDGAYYSS